MGGTQPRIGLNLRVAQKQILTPGLVQMVSVLALNKLELREMINQEMIANPVLEELEEVLSLEEVHQKIETEKPVDGASDTSNGDKQDSFEQIDFGSFFDNYLDPGFKSPATEDIEKPSFENFLAQPSSLADHLELQLRLSTCSEAVRAAAFSIMANLMEADTLTSSPEKWRKPGGIRSKNSNPRW